MGLGWGGGGVLIVLNLVHRNKPFGKERIVSVYQIRRKTSARLRFLLGPQEEIYMPMSIRIRETY